MIAAGTRIEQQMSRDLSVAGVLDLNVGSALYGPEVGIGF